MRQAAKPAKLTELHPDRPAIVEASAGTGKTFLLENLVLDLLIDRGVMPAQLLVLTFAREAAGEVKNRIRLAIEKLLDGSHEKPLPGAMSWTLTPDVQAHLRRALLTLDDGMIGTIHAFCNQVLTDHAFSVGLPPLLWFEGGTERAANAIRAAMRHDLPSRSRVKPYFDLWYASGDASATDLLARLTEIAATQRPFHPLHDPERALVLVQNIRDIRLPKTWRADLTKYGAPLRLDETIEALDELRTELPSGASGGALFAWRDRIGAALGSYLLDEVPEGHAIRTTAGGALLVAAGQLVKECPSARSACLQVFWSCVDERLKAGQWLHGSITYNAMIDALDRAGSLPTWSVLAARLRSAFGHGLLDEFQDTDPCQWAIFRRLFLSGDHPPTLYGVGDPKQAIYGFRGANVHTYFSAKGVVKDGGGPVVSLLENHRSSDAMIKACNLVFASTPEPFFSPPIAYADVTCGNPGIAAAFDGKPAVPFVIAKCVSDNGRAFSLPKIKRLHGTWIAGEIARLVGPGGLSFRSGRDDASRPLNYGDIFVLTFSWADQVELQKWLQLHGIPCVIDGKEGGLLATAEAADVLRLLLAIASPFDPGTARAAWNTPFFGVPLCQLQGMVGSTLERQLQGRLVAWRALAETRRFHRLFSAIVSDSAVVRREIAIGDDERRMTNYLHIFECLRRHAATYPGDFAALIDVLRSAQSGGTGSDGTTPMERRQAEGQAVRLTTIHKSKGLQRPVVFLYGGLTVGTNAELMHGVEQGEQVWYVRPEPWHVQRAIAEGREEWERVLYVALTRAQVRVYVADLEPWSDYHTGHLTLMHDRFAVMAQAGLLVEPLFEIADVAAAARGAALGPAAGSASQAAWPANLDPQAYHPEVNAAHPLKAAATHAPTFVTSYTKLVHSKDDYGRGGDDEEDDEAAAVPTADLPPVAAPVTVPLPDTAVATAPAPKIYRGRLFGIFVHALIDRLPRTSYLLGLAFADWADLAEVAEVTGTVGLAFGFDPEGCRQAARLAYAAMATPLVLPGGTELTPGIAAVGIAVSEGQILFPYPSAAELLGDGARSAATPRGYVTGAIDYVFTHEGRVYFADWKTDSILESGADALAAAFKSSGYDTQAALYTLGLVQALRIKDAAQYDRVFGGHLYCFVRRMADAVAPGVLADRLSWGQLTSFERSLLGRNAAEGKASP